MKDGSFGRLDYTSAFNSLGNYYAYVTHICGYKAQKHEGKITGLAAHGQPAYKEILDSLITFKDGKLSNTGGRVFQAAVKQLKGLLPRDWTKKDFAASIQQHAENLAVEYVKSHIGIRAPRKLAIAGGLFANVRINQKLHEIPGVEEIFIHPGMTDGGLAVGAALVPCMNHQPGQGMKGRNTMIRSVYLGRGYSGSEIEREIRRH